MRDVSALCHQGHSRGDIWCTSDCFLTERKIHMSFSFSPFLPLKKIHPPPPLFCNPPGQYVSSFNVNHLGILLKMQILIWYVLGRTWVAEFLKTSGNINALRPRASLERVARLEALQIADKCFISQSCWCLSAGNIADTVLQTVDASQTSTLHSCENESDDSF